MARLTRRLQVLQHLMKAQEHHNEAMRLLIESEAVPSEPPAPESEPRRVDPRVETASTNLADPNAVTTEVRARNAARPTVHALTAFSRDTALRELAKAWAEATTPATRVRVRDTARRLVASGVLHDADIVPYR